MRKFFPVLAVSLSTLVTLIFFNTLFIYSAPKLVSQQIFPRNLLRHTDGCYQTYYPAIHGENLTDWIAVAGDSYGAGSGDEYLSGAFSYGIFHRLRAKTKSDYLVFARAGFGSINAAKELVQCLELINNSWLLPHIPPPRKIIIIFYEGNDLNNNIEHARHLPAGAALEDFVAGEINTPFDAARAAGFYFPVISVPVEMGRRLGKSALALLSNEAEDGYVNTILLSDKPHLIREYPQSAPVELSGPELQLAQEVFFTSAAALKKHFPQAAVEVVYLPSVVSVYSWKDPVRVQAYHSGEAVFTTARSNLMLSTELRRKIGAFSARSGFKFFDATDRLRQIGAARPVHGPRDWKHLNAPGYASVAAGMSE